MNFSDVKQQDIDFVMENCTLLHLFKDWQTELIRGANQDEVNTVLTIHRLACFVHEACADNVTKEYLACRDADKSDYLAWQLDLIEEGLDSRAKELEAAINCMSVFRDPNICENIQPMFQDRAHGSDEDMVSMKAALSMIQKLLGIKDRIREALNLSAPSPIGDELDNNGDVVVEFVRID